MFDQILAFVANSAIEVISFLGYFGVFLLMTLESTFLPIPSELIMPFAGYLAHKGEMNFWLVALVGGIGATLGSTISYYMGYYGGKPFIEKFGKYFLINEKDMRWTEEWFEKHGEKTIFITRFLPVARHLISGPAGMARMDIKKFVVFTFLGAFLWSLALTYAGFYLGSRWEEVHHLMRPFSIVIVLFTVGVGVWYVWRHLKQRHESN